MTAAKIIYQSLKQLVPTPDDPDHGKVYPHIVPESQDIKPPYIVYNPNVSSVPENSDTGYLDYEYNRVQVDIYHDDDIALEQLRKNVIRKLNNYSNNGRQVFEYLGSQNPPTGDNDLYRATIDGYIYIHENP